MAEPVVGLVEFYATHVGYSGFTVVARLTFARAYRFDDGRVLLVREDGKGRLHESRTALLAMLGEIDAQEPVSPFGALLPQGRDFATQAAALVAELGLPIPAGLAELDSAVRRTRPVRHRLQGTRRVGPVEFVDRRGQRESQAAAGLSRPVVACSPWCGDQEHHGCTVNTGQPYRPRGGCAAIRTGTCQYRCDQRLKMHGDKYSVFALESIRWPCRAWTSGYPGAVAGLPLGRQPALGMALSAP
jgi:hypothetical protein